MKILYIDDNQLNLRLVQKMLRKHEVITCLSGTKGIKLAYQEKPDLVLLDINMGEVDGFKVLSMIRANPSLKTLPVIAVTANAMHGDRERILAAGFNGYVAKPITRVELTNAIRIAVAQV
ncbi:MAG: response regulator [Chloroflexota bacterium]